MSSSVHVDNKGKYILILEKGPTQVLGERSLTAEKTCRLVLLSQRKIVYVCFITVQTVTCLSMVQKLTNLR